MSDHKIITKFLTKTSNVLARSKYLRLEKDLHSSGVNFDGYLQGNSRTIAIGDYTRILKIHSHPDINNLVISAVESDRADILEVLFAHKPDITSILGVMIGHTLRRLSCRELKHSVARVLLVYILTFNNAKFRKVIAYFKDDTDSILCFSSLHDDPEQHANLSAFYIRLGTIPACCNMPAKVIINCARADVYNDSTKSLATFAIELTDSLVTDNRRLETENTKLFATFIDSLVTDNKRLETELTLAVARNDALEDQLAYISGVARRLNYDRHISHLNN